MLIEKIKADQLEARKNKEADTASLLTTLIGEAEMVGKNAGNRAPTDEEVIATAKKFQKNINETMAHLKSKDTPDAALVPYFNELEILDRYLPTKISNDQVEDDIMEAIHAADVELNQKALSVVIKSLKEKYGSQFDGGQVSKVFKSLI